MFEQEILRAYDGTTTEWELFWLELKDVEADDTHLLGKWRKLLKEHLDWLYGRVRPRLCVACGEPFSTFDMHEGIVSRRDVQGWKYPKNLLIMNEINCIPLHHTCNIDRPPSRQQVWDSQVEFYGKELVELWCYDLPWKTKRPPRYFGR